MNTKEQEIIKKYYDIIDNLYNCYSEQEQLEKMKQLKEQVKEIKLLYIIKGGRGFIKNTTIKEAINKKIIEFNKLIKWRKTF